MWKNSTPYPVTLHPYRQPKYYGLFWFYWFEIPNLLIDFFIAGRCARAATICWSYWRLSSCNWVNCLRMNGVHAFKRLVLAPNYFLLAYCWLRSNNRIYVRMLRYSIIWVIIGGYNYNYYVIITLFAIMVLLLTIWFDRFFNKRLN